QATNTSSAAVAPQSNSSPPPANTTAAAAVTPKQAPITTAQKTNETVEELPPYVPAPKSLVSERAASDVETVNVTSAGNQKDVLSSQPKAMVTSLNTKSGNANRVAQLSFLPGDEVLKVGEKRRYVVQLSSDSSLSLALFSLQFDPKVV